MLFLSQSGIDAYPPSAYRCFEPLDRAIGHVQNRGDSDETHDQDDSEVVQVHYGTSLVCLCAITLATAIERQPITAMIATARQQILASDSA